MILKSVLTYMGWKEQNKVQLGHLQDLTRSIHFWQLMKSTVPFVNSDHNCRNMQVIYFKRQLIPFEFWCLLLWMLKCRHYLTQVKLFSLCFFTWTGEHIPLNSVLVCVPCSVWLIKAHLALWDQSFVQPSALFYIYLCNSYLFIGSFREDTHLLEDFI